MKIMSDLDIPSCNVPGLHNCNKSTILGLSQALLHLSLGRVPDIHLAFPQCLGLEVAFLFAFRCRNLPELLNMAEFYLNLHFCSEAFIMGFHYLWAETIGSIRLR